MAARGRCQLTNPGTQQLSRLKSRGGQFCALGVHGQDLTDPGAGGRVGLVSLKSLLLVGRKKRFSIGVGDKACEGYKKRVCDEALLRGAHHHSV